MIKNKELIIAIDKVKAASSQEEALRVAYQLVSEKFWGKRFATYFLFWKFFEWDVNRLWKRRGFMHCTQQNLLMKTLLVESGWFGKDEVSYGYSLVWHVSPHQYLKVKLNGEWLAVDTWNKRYGARLGEYASGFGKKSL